MTTAIYLEPTGYGHKIWTGEEHTSLPDNYCQIVVLDKWSDPRYVSMVSADLAVLRDRIDEVLRGAR